MSLIPKLRTALGVIFILMTAAAVSVTAQTPAAESAVPANAVAIAASTSEPKKTEVAKPSPAPADSTAPDKTAEASRDANNASDVVVSAAPSTVPATAKAATALATFPRSPQGAASDGWQFQFSPYFWLAGLHGDAGVGNRSVQADESFKDIFHTLNFAFMGVFEARKGKLVSLTDLEYVDVGDDKATPGPLFSNVNAKFKTFIFDQEVGYRFYADPAKRAWVNLVGGIRVWHVSSDLAFGAGILPALEVKGSRNWVDAVAGLQGKAAVSKKLFVTGKFDLGGGGSKFTWQVFGGGGFNINTKIALIFGYRALDVNYNKNGFLWDMNERGPIIGLGLKF